MSSASLTDNRTVDVDRLVDRKLVLYFYLASLTYLFISMLGGLLMAFQLIRHNPLSGIEIFSPGRWRMVHTNAIAYGFIANALLGSVLGCAPPDAAARAQPAAQLVHLHRLAGGRAGHRRGDPAGPGAGIGMG